MEEQTQTTQTTELAVKDDEAKKLPATVDLRVQIYAQRGSITQLAEHFDLSPIQIEELITKRKLDQDLAKSRTLLEDDAVAVLQQCLKSEDEKVRLECAKFMLTKLQSAKPRWSDGPQIAQQIVMSDQDKNLSIKNIFGIATPAQQEIEEL